MFSILIPLFHFVFLVVLGRKLEPISANPSWLKVEVPCPVQPLGSIFVQLTQLETSHHLTPELLTTVIFLTTLLALGSVICHPFPLTQSQ